MCVCVCVCTCLSVYMCFEMCVFNVYICGYVCVCVCVCVCDMGNCHTSARARFLPGCAGRNPHLCTKKENSKLGETS